MGPAVFIEADGTAEAPPSLVRKYVVCSDLIPSVHLRVRLLDIFSEVSSDTAISIHQLEASLIRHVAVDGLVHLQDIAAR